VSQKRNEFLKSTIFKILNNKFLNNGSVKEHFRICGVKVQHDTNRSDLMKVAFL